MVRLVSRPALSPTFVGSEPFPAAAAKGLVALPHDIWHGVDHSHIRRPAQPRDSMDVLALPFNALIGLTRSSGAGSPLSLPADPRYTNHLGTVHASAL